MLLCENFNIVSLTIFKRSLVVNILLTCIVVKFRWSLNQQHKITSEMLTTKILKWWFLLSSSNCNRYGSLDFAISYITILICYKQIESINYIHLGNFCLLVSNNIYIFRFIMHLRTHNFPPNPHALFAPLSFVQF